MKLISLRFPLVLSALLLCVASLWAVPAYRGWQQRTLADGTTITVRLVGDEFYHYWETQDGQIAHEQEDGTFAISSEQRPSAKTIKRNRAASPYMARPIRKVGVHNMAPRGLVILVNFADVSFNSANGQAAFNDLMNSTNYTHNDAYGSVREYFRAQSNGAYVPDFDVVGPVTLSNNRSAYGGNTSSKQGSDTNPAQMIADACNAVNSSVNFATYDNDNDGYIDFVYVIYAGEGEADGGPAESIWPHNWYVRSGAGIYCTLDGKKLDNYACSAELNHSDGSRSGIGTIAHEFGHVIGMPDYYDTEYGTNDDNGVTPYKWSIMDQGSYNNGGRTPPNYSIFDKYYMGWATPKFLAVSAKANVTMTTGYSDAYQITGGSSLLDYDNTSTIYYIENRQKSGWDGYIPGSGMLVWKVIFSQTAWSKNEPNNEAGNPRYTIVPADKKTTNYGRNASDVFPTGSVKYYKPLNGCELSEITKSGSNITFKYNGGVSATHWDYTLYGEQCTYPADGTVLKNAALELTITPDEGYTLANAVCWDVTMGGSALTYGTDFTYNSSTDKFRIESVTGDVEIMAEGLHPVTWMASGNTYATNVAVDGKITLPDDNPDDCSATMKFVGWCTSSNYSHASTAPTFAKTGDTYSAATYYAVYATSASGNAPHRAKMTESSATYTFTSSSWAATLNGSSANWTSGKAGAGYSNSGVQVTTNASGANATCPNSYSNITSIVVSYCTNASKGAGTIKMTVDGNDVSQSVSTSGGTTARNLTFDFSGSTPSGAPKITVTCTTNSIYVCGLTINYGSSGGSGSSGDYTAYTTVCQTCTLTGITLNTSSVTKTFVKGATFNYDNLVVTANYSDCNSKTVTPTNVSTPDMSSTGEKTVTVSYTEDGEEKTATYKINVVNPYTVTYMFCGDEFTTQQYAPGATLVLPTETPVESTGKTFYGWTTTEHYTGASAPAIISAGSTVNANATYYAVFH